MAPLLTPTSMPCVPCESTPESTAMLVFHACGFHGANVQQAKVHAKLAVFFTYPKNNKSNLGHSTMYNTKHLLTHSLFVVCPRKQMQYMFG